MIPRLYLSDSIEFESNGEGLLKDITECYVVEERNGLFDLTFRIPLGSFLFEKIEKGNIIKAHASDRLRNQLFRINIITKPIDGIVIVYAKHISFDLDKDFIDKLTINGQSCEYVLNEIFRNSKFSKHFKGKSDIVNSQDYNIELVSPLEAIGGKEGSVIDTFGNSADILRDNFTISVLNDMGKHNNVLLAYRKNITGFELVEDIENVVGDIYPYAEYSNENNETIRVTIDEEYVTSPRKVNYKFPTKILPKDFSEKFVNDEVPTQEKLRQLSKKYFTESKCDIPKLSYKIEFIPLSKTENYKEMKFLEDIGMSDKLFIWNSKYNIRDEAKVIKTKYNVLTEKYESIELGEPRTTLGDIITGSNNDKVSKDEVKDIINNTPSTNYPNTLPNVPVVTLKAGLGVIAIDWTFEAKAYYTYEVYASRTKDFTPNAFDLIFKGQASTFSHYSEPNQTWYYRVRAINTHNNGTDFSEQKFATTGIIDKDSQWIGKAAIGDLQVGTLSLDRGWVDQLKGEWIDARKLTVTDGNGLRTMDIDSFGRVRFKVSELEILAGATTNVPTKTDVTAEIKTAKTELNKSISGVSDNVDNLKRDTEEALKDNTLTDNEKRQIEANLKPLATEFAEQQKDYDTRYKNTNLTGTAKTNLKNAYDSYVLKYNNLVTTINSLLKLTTITEVNKMALNQAYAEHDIMLATYRTRAEEAIDNIAQNKSNAAKSGAEGTAKTYTDAKIKVVDGKITEKVSQADYDENNRVINEKLVETTKTVDGIRDKVTKIEGDYVTGTEFTQTVDGFEFKVKNNGGFNLLRNSDFSQGFNLWGRTNPNHIGLGNDGSWGCPSGGGVYINCQPTLTVQLSQIIKPKTSKANHIFSAWVRADDIKYYPEYCPNNEYCMSNVYISVYYKDGTTDWINRPIQNEFANKVWGKLEVPLNPYNKQIEHIIVYLFARYASGKIYMSQPKVEEGKIATSWRPSQDELYTGITTIDSEGIKVTHEQGSFSKLSSKELYQANENGDRSMSMRFGGLRTYQFPNNGNSSAGFLGGLTSTVQANTNLFGNTIFGSSLAGYTSIGFSENSADNQHKGIMPWLTMVHYDGNSEPYQGIYAYKPLFMKNKISMRGNDIESISTLRFEEGWSQIFCTGVAGSYWKMISAGETQTSMSVMTSNTNASEYFRITKNGDALMWCNLNMQNFQIKNARAIATLEAKTQKTKELTKKINTDLSAIYSTNEEEIRHSGSIFTSNGYAYIEIPSYLAENIREDYKVVIGKYGFGDYYIANKTAYGFEIISEKDIKFDYEIIATRIDDGSSYSNTIYANEQYRTNEVNRTKNNEEAQTEIASSKYTVLSDEEIERVIEVEELKENNELWKLYRK